LAYAHSNGAHEEKVATAELLNHVQAGEGRGDIYGIGNDLDDERVLEVCVLEVLRSVIDCI
jgi:hypothetical protein